MIELGQMNKPCNQPTEQSISYQPTEMKSGVMRYPFQPEHRCIDNPILFRGINIKGIRHHQRAAHPQAMKASHQTD